MTYDTKARAREALLSACAWLDHDAALPGEAVAAIAAAIDEARIAGPSAAASDVLAERERQKSVEGWTPEHDDKHDEGQMADAAACYAMTKFSRNWLTPCGNVGDAVWPWKRSWWKLKDRRRDLVRAGALILAEIERLDRITARISELTAPPTEPSP